MIAKINDQVNAAGGYYLLLIRMKAQERISIGALGELNFRGGYYIYVGSALSGLRQRVGRHMRPEKNVHWHIDYLLRRAAIVDVILFPLNHAGAEEELRNGLLEIIAESGAGLSSAGTAKTECLIAFATASHKGISAPAAGFGSSDCRCKSHLCYSEKKPSGLIRKMKSLQQG